MARQRIHIENLRIKLPRTMTANAHNIGDSFGREIVRSIAAASCGRKGAVRIDEISAAKIKANGGEADMLKRVAMEVAAVLKKKLD